MIIDIILLIVMLYGLLSGLMRGGVLQFFSLVGFIIALIVARLFSNDLGDLISSLLTSDNNAWSIFYNAIAFFVIFFVVQIIIKKIAHMLNFFTKLPVIGFLNRIIGAVLGFVQMYLIAFLVIIVLFLLPSENVSEYIEGSNVAMYMINSTPVLSDFFKTMWFN